MEIIKHLDKIFKIFNMIKLTKKKMNTIRKKTKIQQFLMYLILGLKNMKKLIK